MNGRRGFERSLRWYPKDWRDRYGDELVALLEDTYGDQPLPLRCRLSLVRAGAAEWLTGSGPEQDRDGRRQQVRSGSLLVLCAWSAFVVAGAGFAKFAEHWDAVTPPADRRLPAAAFAAVQGAALAGAVLILVGAAAALPAFVRSMRRGGWSPIRRPVLRAVAATSVTVMVTVGIAAWARYLGPRQRQGALWPYAGAGVLLVLAVVASIATCSAAAVAAIRYLHLPVRVLRLEGALALMATATMAAILAGTLVWWGALAANAPWFFGSGVVGSSASPVPPAMVLSGSLMTLALAAAVLGAGRVARSLTRMSAD
ncbi:MAG: hypothetical protein IVW52_06230 [Acidimicrobiales bacterium]|nr:hypothetical protein [Acidimicrobiales bacterium]